jgi:hypothetical protein
MKICLKYDEGEWHKIGVVGETVLWRVRDRNIFMV